MNSFCKVAAAAELLTRGVDISVYKTAGEICDELQSVEKYRILIDEATKDMFKLDSVQVFREKRAFYCKQTLEDDFKPDLRLSIGQVKMIMQLLWEHNLEAFVDFKEQDYVEGYEELMKNLDKDFVESVPMMEELSRDKTNEALRIFLALFDYDKGYSKKLYDDAQTDKEFPVAFAKDYTIKDNRMYIWIKPSMMKKLCLPDSMKAIKAFVISKNVYDYFWASYGNSWQSCFALNSTNDHLYGYVPFALAPESFMCYATTGGVNKIPIISGKQFRCPNMLFRCWGYADDCGQLLLDREFSSLYSEDIKKFLDKLATFVNIVPHAEGERGLLNHGRGIHNIYKDINCRFYADSLRCLNESVTFRYRDGFHDTGEVQNPWRNKYATFIDYASTITAVSPSLTLDKPFGVENGLLLNFKVCPTTGLIISEEETKSPFAKFYTKDCKSSAVITYLGGQVFLDTMTGKNYSNTWLDFSKDVGKRGFAGGTLYIKDYTARPFDTNKSITLKTLKEMLKGQTETLGLDGILLRYFEGYEVKYQFYKTRRKDNEGLA